VILIEQKTKKNIFLVAGNFMEHRKVWRLFSYTILRTFVYPFSQERLRLLLKINFQISCSQTLVNQIYTEPEEPTLIIRKRTNLQTVIYLLVSANLSFCDPLSVTKDFAEFSLNPIWQFFLQNLVK
jgi:hypothetical protein